MAQLLFTKDHEWIRVDGDTGTVGISAYAQQQLGDIVFVELPENGREIQRGSEAAVVESVKAASEVYAPASGEVIESNAALAEEPGLANTDPLGAGWFFKVKITNAADLESLMDEGAYQTYLEGIG